MTVPVPAAPTYDVGELRARLVEAMRYQYRGHDGAYERMLNAALSVLADEIEAVRDGDERTHYDACSLTEAAALIRWWRPVGSIEGEQDE